MEPRKTFWTDSRRRLIAKTLANLFLLLIGASATGEAIVGLPGWLRVVVWAVVITSGVAAVVIMPEDKGENTEGT